MIELVPAAQIHATLLAAMHKVCFADPWTEQGFLQGLSSLGTEGLMAVDQGTLVPSDGSLGGPAGMVLWRKLFDEGEILTICVLPPWRGKGLGERLLRAALAQMQEGGVTRLFLEAAETNTEALALYAKLGFRQISRRKNYYRDVDALILECHPQSEAVGK
ncbi:MAG TPA: GNAT family N-acetyltransferase [Rhodospirillaceae bacterium]|nr:GNAT family N-acetyltransferase [Rhodospirillaceae bacterium]